MAQLANANLLDDSVANSSSLKTERLYKTAQKAINPNPKPRVAVKEEKVKEQEEEIEIEDDFEEEEETPTPIYSKSKSKKYQVEEEDEEEDKDKKILGMKPVVFYGLLAIGLAVGGYFAYKKFFKKKIAATPTPTPVVSTPDVPPTSIG